MERDGIVIYTRINEQMHFFLLIIHLKRYKYKLEIIFKNSILQWKQFVKKNRGTK